MLAAPAGVDEREEYEVIAPFLEVELLVILVTWDRTFSKRLSAEEEFIPKLDNCKEGELKGVFPVKELLRSAERISEDLSKTGRTT